MEPTHTASAAVQGTVNRRLSGKDLINIGIFSALYFVLNFAFMLMSGLHPMIWILMPGLIALTTGIPFMLMCTKVRKAGAVVIMGFITALIYFVTGMFTPLILGMMAAACIVAESIRWVTHYSGFAGETAAFAAFSLGMCGSPLPIWIFHDSFFAQIASQGMSADYITTLDAFSSTPMLIVLFAAPVVLAVLGALIAKALFRKHFEKAGMI